MLDCHQCKHYYVTWDPASPHGCHAMGFKSLELPNLAVRASTGGRDCLMFTPKPPPKRKPPKSRKSIIDTKA